jgi:hypothetical protein
MLEGRELARACAVSVCARENGWMGAERVDVEAALLRTLRDIDDGHLSLWVRVRYFDAVTGQRLKTPVVAEVHPDRQPYPGVPDRRGEWWRALVERGWLELPPPGSFPMRYFVSDDGKHAFETGAARCSD